MNLTSRYHPVAAQDSATRADATITWLREYFQRRVNSRWIDERRCIPPHIVLDLGRQGIFGYHVDVEHGGTALRAVDWSRVIAQLAALDSTIASFVAVQCLATRTFASFGTPGMKAELLPLLARGQMLGAYAQTEPQTGSDFLSLATAARPDASGWKLYGDKVYIGNAGWAGVLAVIARVEGTRGPLLTAYCVRAGSEGLNIGEEHATMGLRGMVQNRLRLDGVRVEAADIIGTRNAGVEVAVDAMSFTRLILAAHQIGVMKRCVQLMHRYAARRTISTGRLIDNVVAVNYLSESIARAFAAETFLRRVLQDLDDGREVALETAAMAKLITSEFAGVVVNRAVQLLGGRGYEETNHLPQLLRDSRVFPVFEGPTETMAAFIGGRVRNRDAAKQIPSTERLLATKPHRNLSPEQMKQWVDITLGARACWAALDDAYRDAPARLAGISDWLAAHTDNAGVPALGLSDCFLSPAEIDQVIGQVESDIGCVDQQLPGLCWTPDDLLRA